MSDLLTWLAYLSIPLVLLYFTMRRRTAPFPALFGLFSVFALACGFTHLLEAISFHRPLYRLAGLVKLVTALASWGTVVALGLVLSRALDWRLDLEAWGPGVLAGGPQRRFRTWTRYALAALVMGVAGLIRLGLEPALADRLRYLPFVVAQVFAAWFGGFGPGLLALSEGIVFTSYWIVPPASASPQTLVSDQIGLGLFVVTGLAVALISEAQGAAHRRAKVSLAEVTAKRHELEEEVRRRRAAEADLRRNENQLRRQAAHLATAQRETAESLALLDALIAHAPLGLAFFEARGLLLRANRLFTEMIGLVDGPWMGRSIAELPPAVAAEIGRDFSCVTQTGQRVLDRVVLLPGPRDSGGERVWQISLYPVSATGSPLLGVGVVVQEITERVRGQRQLEASERRFRALADAVPQIVWVARADGAVTYFNSRWYEYTSSTPERSLPGGWVEQLHPEDRDRTRARWAQSLATGEPYEIEYRIRGADGAHRWFLGRGVPQRDEDGAITLWFGSCTDIDDRRRAAETLEGLIRDRTAELRRSNRALEEFAYVASHDLQEPLRKIQAFGDRLRTRSRDALGDQGREYLDRIFNATQRMRTLITDLLAFSRVTTQTQPFAAVDLSGLVREVLGDLEERIQQTGGTVHVGPLPVIRADLLQMRQLFLNLIGNALKFHKPGVPPVVHVEGRLLDEAPRAGENGGAGRTWCEIRVRDNGIGFEEEYRDRIFQVFQRLHGRQEYDGTGVGLAICRRIIERHRGRITAQSAPGEGATFLVTLPLDGPSETEPAHEP